MSKILTPDKPVVEKAAWSPVWYIKRFENSEAFAAYWKELKAKARALRFSNGIWHPDFEKLSLDLAPRFAYAVNEVPNNGLANDGCDEIWTLVGGSGGTQFDNTNAHLGAGNSSDVFDATETDLQGASKKRCAMMETYPTYGSSQKITFKSSFGSDDANFAWEEFAAFNASESGTMLNRKVESEGTKTSGQTWELTLEITLS